MSRYIVQLTGPSVGFNRHTPRRAVLRVSLENKKACAPGRTVDGQPVSAFVQLSIVADIFYPGDRARDPRMVGQCYGTIAEHWGDNPLVAELVEIWKRWHLNGLRAGNRAQEEHLRANPVDAVYPVSHYDAACSSLKEAGLQPSDGYRYGTAWLVEPLPLEVIDRIGEICRELGGREL